MRTGPHYYAGTGRLLRLLRFLNLLEPDRAVLSISKTYMWTMVGLTVFVVVSGRTDFGSLVASVSGSIIGAGNYAYRRHLQSQAPDQADVQTEEGR